MSENLRACFAREALLDVDVEIAAVNSGTSIVSAPDLRLLCIISSLASAATSALVCVELSTEFAESGPENACSKSKLREALRDEL